MSTPTRTAAHTGDRSAAIAELTARVSGRVAREGEAGYELAMPFNVAIRQAPLAVVEATSAQDIAETVRIAAAHGLRVTVRRTGHGAVTVDGDDIVMVHTGRLDTLEIDEADRTARIGAGAIWQHVIDAAAPYGLAPLVGSSPTVGAIGFLTGCGIGPFVRTFGLSSDHVRSFQVVTGDGQLLRAAPDENPDLFWGLRGGKGSLGIVTEAVIDLVPMRTFYGGALYFAADDAAAVVEAWRELCVDLPEHANTSIAILQLPPLPHIPAPLAGKLTVAVRYTSTAPAAEAEALLAPLRAVAEPVLDGVAELPFTAVAGVHADPTEPMPVHENSTLLREFTPEAVQALLAVAGPESGSVQTIVELRLLGGELAREPQHGSAFTHRAAGFAVLTIGVLAPPIAEAVPGHAAAVIGALSPWATGGLLPNFTATDDPEKLARCYDDDARHWLGALAERHDPAGVLNVGQVIRATAVA